nr:MAG TPA: hypothetical protein [Caudoviricetes sp.]
MQATARGRVGPQAAPASPGPAGGARRNRPSDGLACGPFAPFANRKKAVFPPRARPRTQASRRKVLLMGHCPC